MRAPAPVLRPHARIECTTTWRYPQSVQLGECSLSFLHTRGHANHHTCVVDRDFGGVFSGDSFGIAYPANAVAGEFDGSHHTDGERFMFPGTAPADYDTEEALKAVDNVRGGAVKLCDVPLLSNTRLRRTQLTGRLRV